MREIGYCLKITLFMSPVWVLFFCLTDTLLLHETLNESQFVARYYYEFALITVIIWFLRGLEAWWYSNWKGLS